MAASKKDPTEPIRLRASAYAGVAKGTSCTQSSFKAGKSAFLYIGEQGGRYKAMFKLGPSKPEAERLAKQHPQDYQTGATSWVTARFDAANPMPKRLWTKWLDESYALSLGGGAATDRAPKKKAAKKRKAVKKRKAARATARKQARRP